MSTIFFNVVLSLKVWLCLFVLFTISTTSLAQESIRVSYATLSPAYMDHIVAMDKGYLKEEGLNVEVIRAPGGVATPGLFQVNFISAAPQARR